VSIITPELSTGLQIELLTGVFAIVWNSLPRGKRSGEHYGGWDRYMV
jgi:hypothetical protein